MDLIEIRNIVRKDIPLHYREEFTCTAVFRDGKNSLEMEVPIEFSLESNVFGNRSVEVKVKGPVDYPVIPIRKAVEEYIMNLDSERKIR